MCVLLLVGCNDNVVSKNPVNQPSEQVEEPLNAVVDDQTSEDHELAIDPVDRCRIMVDILNIRTEASVDSELIGRVYLDGVYEVLSTKEVMNDGESEIWYEIEVKDKKGWIASWFCELTEKALMDYNPQLVSVEIPINEYYLVNHVLDFKTLIDWESYNVFYKTAGSLLEIEGPLELISNGMLDITIHDMMGRTRTFSFYIRLLEETTYEKALYESMSLDSKIIGFSKDVDLSYDEDSEAYYSIVDGKLSGWYKAKYMGRPCYYYNYDFYHANSYININKVTFILDDGETIYLETDGRLDRRFSESGILSIGPYSHNTVINMTTGDMYEFNNMRSFEDQKILVNYHSFSEEFDDKEEDEKLIQVFKVKPGELELIYEETITCLGVRNVRLEEQNLFYDIYHVIKDEWGSVSSYGYEEAYQLSLDDRTLTKVSGDIHSVNNRDPDEVITIFSELDKTSLIGEVKSHEVEAFDYLRIIEVIDGELCNWFEITLDDGQKVYTYRRRTDDDGERLYLIEPLYFLCKDGSQLDLMTFSNNHFFYMSTLLKDDLLFKNILTLNYYYEGIYSSYYSILDGSRVDLPMEGEIQVSDDQKYLVNIPAYYGGSYKDLIIYDLEMDYKKLVKVFNQERELNFNFGYWDKNTYHFQISQYTYGIGTEYFDGSISLTDNGWVINGENLFNLEIQ